MERMACWRVEEDLKKGRSIISTSPLSPGDLVWIEKPRAAFPSHSHICTVCFNSPENDSHSERKRETLSCSKCKKIRYCGRQCQRIDWKRAHKYECGHEALMKLCASDRGLVMLLFRFFVSLVEGDDKERKIEILKKEIQETFQMDEKFSLVPKEPHSSSCSSKQQDSQKLFPTTPRGAPNQSFFGLLSHKLSQSPETIGHSRSLSSILSSLLSLLSPPFPSSLFTLDVLLSSFLCCRTNNTQISDSQLFEIGGGIYPGTALLNHSCLPNCAPIFSGTTLYLRVVSSIQEGEELTQSYIDPASPTSFRQSHLSSGYFFSCNCLRCRGLFPSLVLDIDEETTVKEKGSCREAISRKEKAQKIKREFEEILKQKDLTKNFSKLSHLSESFFPLLPSLHVDLLKFSSIILDACLELGRWKEAETHCVRILQIYQQIYPPFHPLIGLQCFTLAKIQWNGFKAKEAAESLMKSREILAKLILSDDPVLLSLDDLQNCIAKELKSFDKK